MQVYQFLFNYYTYYNHNENKKVYIVLFQYKARSRRCLNSGKENEQMCLLLMFFLIFWVNCWCFSVTKSTRSTFSKYSANQSHSKLKGWTGLYSPNHVSQIHHHGSLLVSQQRSNEDDLSMATLATADTNDLWEEGRRCVGQNPCQSLSSSSSGSIRTQWIPLRRDGVPLCFPETQTNTNCYS